MQIAAITRSVATPFEKWRDFSGRAGRREFWTFFLFCLICELPLLGLDVSLNLYFPAVGCGIFSGIFSLATLVPLVSVTTRRLHDVGKSGWLQLVIVIPFVGAVALLTFWLRASQPRTNEYGPPSPLAS
ncbi:MAG: DUF805 domain-containing protein [Rhodocyclaceae bacterium]|nr:DUF805 domain-containing protein [Rhodocyclaceae bacterium]